MFNVSEELSQMSLEWLLKLLGAFGQFGFDATRLGFGIGKEGADTLLGLLNYLEKRYGKDYDIQTQMAMDKLAKECEKENASALKMTVPSNEFPEFEKWLKKQDFLYVACSPKQKPQTPEEKLNGTGKNSSDLTTIFYMEKDAQKIHNAASIIAYNKGLINVLPPQAFLLLYDNKKDISVVDGLDFYELRVFRELAKKHGLGFAEMENGPEQEGESVPGTYKVICGKEHAGKLTAIMRVVSWTLSGKDADSIKEKIKERETLATELEKLILGGVKDGSQIMVDEDGNKSAVENAKYIVNALAAHQYVKITAKGFHLFKGGNEGLFVSIDDLDYEEKLEKALVDFPDYVIFDSVEWEKEGLGKSNLRKTRASEKMSVLPPDYSVENEETDIRKAHKKHRENYETLDDSVWLFHKYDPDNDEHLSEVVESNYNNPSKPPEETVSVHYNSASQNSRKYKYYDVESDEKTVDKIILAAQEKALGNRDYEKTTEKEAVR